MRRRSNASVSDLADPDRVAACRRTRTRTRLRGPRSRTARISSGPPSDHGVRSRHLSADRGQGCGPAHPVARNHALVDGNKRHVPAATLAFLGVNGYQLTLTNNEAYDLVIAVAAGELDEVEPTSLRLTEGVRSR